MGTISGMLALAVLGSEPTATSEDGAKSKPIVCQARVMTVDASTWRTALGDRLDSISRKKGTTVWTAPRAIQPALNEMAADERVRQARLVFPTAETPASASLVRTIPYYQSQQMGSFQPATADSRLGKSPLPARMPEFRVEQAQVEERFEIRCTARRLEQGTLAQVRVADTHVVAMHKVPNTDEAGIIDVDYQITGEACNATPLDLLGDVLGTVAETPLPTLGFLRLAIGAADGVTGAIEAACNPAVSLGKVEVPEVVAATVEGEWLVAKDSILIVSLGVHTAADAQGKAVARERVAILDFKGGSVLASAPTPDAMVLPAGAVIRACEVDGPPAVPIALSRLNTPALPARSLPEAIDKDGQVVELPPLPEEYAAADLNRISPGSPLASGQSPLVRSAESSPLADPQLARTSFEMPTDAVTCSPDAAQPTRLATLVEGFLRQGMGTADDGCPAEPCPAAPEAPCPAEANDCPACPADRSCLALPAAPKPVVSSVHASFSAALQNPGTTETRFIPLGKGLALEVRVRVVPRPNEANGPDEQAEVGALQRSSELLVDGEKLRVAGEEWQRFWFLDQPSRMTPFRHQGAAR